MTDLIRRALMGDKQAQNECTAQYIALPCPFCGKEMKKMHPGSHLSGGGNHI